MIHHHSIGDARIAGVIEYSGPTHAPEFLYPAVPKAERDAVLQANAGWLAPHPYPGELSMGMSEDLEVAIEEGATLVRVGRALFGDRPV